MVENFEHNLRFEKEIVYSPERAAIEKKIAMLEGLSIGPEQKASIILVLLGLKPATELLLYSNNDKPGKVAETILATGLDIRLKRENEKVTVFAIARDTKTLEQLVKVTADKDHEAFGKLMGYPDSAINAFLHKEDQLDETEEQKLLGDDNDINLGVFKLSKDNYKKELDLIKQWNTAIETFSPNTYHKLKRSLMETN